MFFYLPAIVVKFLTSILRKLKVSNLMHEKKFHLWLVSYAFSTRSIIKCDQCFLQEMVRWRHRCYDACFGFAS